MPELKAIETEYNGYKFRSRLEAKWAVFFDAMNISYEYEPEGFVLSNGAKYLPDFYLPLFKMYVEVKPETPVFISYNGDYVTFDKGFEKYGYFAHDIAQAGYSAWFVFGDPQTAILPEDLGGKESNELFSLSMCASKFLKSHGIKVSCDCDGKKCSPESCKHPDAMASGKVISFFEDFVCWSSDMFPVNGNALPIDYMVSTSRGTEKIGTKQFRYKIINSIITLQDACLKARQARFEHGETPKF